MNLDRLGVPRRDELSPEIKEACVVELREFRDSAPGVNSIGLVGPDGFEVASVTKKDMAVSKVAALTSTMVAVAHAVTKEVGLSQCRDLILESDNGRVLFMDVTTEEKTYALFVVATSDALLGRVISRAKTCVAGLTKILAGA